VKSTLSPLQVRVIRTLAHLDWTLTGGAALAGYHLGHRTTRDLDFFWMGKGDLERIPAEVERRLVAEGLQVDRLQTSPGFVRIRVASEDEAMPVDLVAEPMSAIEPPLEAEPGVRVDTRFAILVNKLGALLSRWAVRDLVDVRALLEAGEDLTRGLEAAARRDGGFSPQTLAWVLDTAPTVGLDDDLLTFRRTLVERLLG
jgi:hypothetical protein